MQSNPNLQYKNQGVLTIAQFNPCGLRAFILSLDYSKFKKMVLEKKALHFYVGKKVDNKNQNQYMKCY